jgi:hypothetical protein
LSDVKALDTFLKLQFEDCHRDAAAFQTFLERWYNDKMDFAWERYQRQVKYCCFSSPCLLPSCSTPTSLAFIPGCRPASKAAPWK